MNKLILLMALALVLVGSAFAAPLTLVTGTVTDGSHSPVNGAAVNVVCHHVSADYIVDTTTGIDGKYYAFFPAMHCDVGDNVTITATFGENSGTNTGVVTFSRECRINTAIIDVTIPEFGVVAGMGALALGVGIVLFRRKH